jgi:hypothetical protein
LVEYGWLRPIPSLGCVQTHGNGTANLAGVLRPELARINDQSNLKFVA